jgi:hypothetical protein
MNRPREDEYAPDYARYVARVPDRDLTDLLVDQWRETESTLRAVPEARAGFRYAPEKWSIKEVVGHLADAERVFTYRLLRIARADETPLAGFEENDYVRVAGFDRRPLAELVAELGAIRASTVALVRGLGDEESRRRGTANGQAVSARALACIIAGHELHHRETLRTRYGLGA